MKKTLSAISLVALLGCATPDVAPQKIERRPATLEEAKAMGTKVGPAAMDYLVSNGRHYTIHPIYGPSDEFSGIYAILRTNAPNSMLKNGILASSTNVVNYKDGIYVPEGGRIGNPVRRPADLKALLGR
jgi:hypothetical protein